MPRRSVKSWRIPRAAACAQSTAGGGFVPSPTHHSSVASNGYWAPRCSECFAKSLMAIPSLRCRCGRGGDDGFLVRGFHCGIKRSPATRHKKVNLFALFVRQGVPPFAASVIPSEHDSAPVRRIGGIHAEVCGIEAPPSATPARWQDWADWAAQACQPCHASCVGALIYQPQFPLAKCIFLLCAHVSNALRSSPTGSACCWAACIAASHTGRKALPSMSSCWARNSSAAAEFHHVSKSII